MNKLKCLIRGIMSILCLLITTHAFAWDFEVDGYCYNKLTESTCALALPTGKGGLSYYTGDVAIPEYVTYRGVQYAVTKIANCAFSRSQTSGSSITYNDELLSVTLPATLEEIADNGFRGCRKLTSITIPASVTKVGYTAFEGCSKISDVTIVDGDIPINFVCGNTNYRGVFSDCPLTKIHIGRNITMSLLYSSYDDFCYSNGPFSWKDKLVEVKISDNVTEIPDYLFYGNSKMSNIILGNNITKIGRGAFRNCSNLEYVVLGTAIESIDYQAFKSTSRDLKVYMFSDVLKTIGSELCPVATTFYVLDKNIYSKILADYDLQNMFVVEALQAEYSGLFNTPNITNNTDFELSINPPVNVGDYKTISAQISAFGNIIDVKIPCNIVINKAPITTIPNNVSRQYGSANPELKCSFFGFKNNETADVLTRLPNVETTATVNSPVGTYPIIATGAEAQNYSFTYERGTLTITKADQEIEWNQSFGTVNVGNVVELTATSTSGLPIKYTATDESIAEIYSQGGKKFVEFLKPGTVSIRANQVGNENYNEADRVSKSVTVASLVKEVILNQTSVNLNEGDTYQLTAIISPSDAPNKTLEWSSSNTEVATVDADGKITAIKQGQTTITAKTTDGSNITSTCEVKVLKLVSGIVLNVSSASLAEGQTLQLNATITPEQADDKTLQWISSNEAIATVDQSGLVTAVAKGSAKIRVESVDGSGVYAECDVEVYAYSGIDTISADGIQITTEPFIATIHGVEEGTIIRLFDMSGNILYLGSEPRVEVGQTGLYILVVNNKAYKIKL